MGNLLSEAVTCTKTPKDCVAGFTRKAPACLARENMVAANSLAIGKSVAVPSAECDRTISMRFAMLGERLKV